MYDPYDPMSTTPPLSGINAPGNTLTTAGPTQEPYGVGAAPSAPMDPMKKQMMMALMAQQLGKMGGRGLALAPMKPRLQLDIYGNPV